MYDVLKSNIQNPSQNFAKTPNFSTNPKSWVTKDEMHEEMNEKESYQRKEMILRPKNTWGRGLK